MATSKTGIANLALTNLGQELISDITEDNDSARTLNNMYDSVRDAALRMHPWNFAIKRETIAADPKKPKWKWANSFRVPSDFLRMIETEFHSPFEIEGNNILSNETGALNIKYVARIEDPAQYDSLFVEVFAAMLAVQAVERIAQSNAKKSSLERDLKVILHRARSVDGQENDFQVFVEDTWITAMR